MSEKTMEFSQKVKAPVKQVYAALTKAALLQNWFADLVETDPKEGGRYYVSWNDGYSAVGLFKATEENRKVAFSWQGLGEPHPTEVGISLEEQDGATNVTVKHGNLGEGEAWEEAAKELKKGWEYALVNLKSILETGLDRRVYDRPMLGVVPSTIIDAEEAKKRGLPKDYGCQLTDVVAGLGAEAAGLQRDDILLSIGEVELHSFNDFATAVAPHKAGDTVEVRYVRDGKEQSLDMLLSGRPVPEFPETVKGLAQAAREMYAEFDQQLDEIFAGVSEEEAHKRPSEDEWSAREVLAHLLMNEQWNHMNVTNLARGQKPMGYANHHETYAAMAHSYPSTKAMLEAFKLSEAITVAAIDHLPEDFAAQKNDFHNLGVTIIQGTEYHHAPHFAQMREAIQAARV